MVTPTKPDAALTTFADLWSPSTTVADTTVGLPEHQQESPGEDTDALEASRGARLRDELRFLTEKQTTERAQVYSDCPNFDDFLRCVQLDMITPFHRRKVFEWNIDLADVLKLSNQALMLAFTYFDRYLSVMPCRLTDLQLVSTACVWTASKVCSTECPVATATQMAGLFTGTTARDVLRMEGKLLSVLKWRMHPAMPYDIVHLVLPFVSCDNPDLHVKLSQYTENILLTIALVYPMVKYDHIVLAVTAVACSCELVAGVPLNTLDILPQLVALVGADMECAVECVNVLRQNVQLDRLRTA